MQIRIREASVADLSHLLHHRRAMFQEMGLGDAASLVRMNEVSKEYFPKALRDGTYKGWLAEDGSGRVVAGGGLVLVSFLARFSGRESRSARMDFEHVYRACCAPQGTCKTSPESDDRMVRQQRFPYGFPSRQFRCRPLYESFGFQPTNEMLLKLQ